jgi:hypothetical protein
MPQSVHMVHSLKVLESQSSPCESGYGDHFFSQIISQGKLALVGTLQGNDQSIELSCCEDLLACHQVVLYHH